MDEKKDVNLEEFTHSLRYLMKNNILGDISEIYEYASGRKSFDISDVSNIMHSFSNYMMSAENLASGSYKLYRFRQLCIERKQMILDDQSFMTSELVKMKKREMISYKVGTNDDGIRPSNDMERRTLLDNNLSDLQQVVDVLDNHISFITDTIKNISDMIYGFQYVLQLEEYRKSY